MIELIRSVVNTFGFREIHVARDGDEGFETFCRFNPDLVISDWMMTPTNGIEMAHKIRQHPSSPNKFVPIILLTGYSQKKRVIEARDRGITEFIVKPFKVHHLYRRIENIVEVPRQFVDATEFFGPDRRRKKVSDYNGPFRRERDEEERSRKEQMVHSEDNLYKEIIRQQKIEEERARTYHDPLVIDFEEDDDDR